MDWTSAEAALETTVAGVFDKTAFRVLPRHAGIGVNQPRISDASRSEFDAMGTLEFGPPTLPGPGRFAGDPSARGMPVAFEAVLTAHVATWPYVPVRGDRIVAGSKSWDVANVERDGTARAILYLNSAR